MNDFIKRFVRHALSSVALLLLLLVAGAPAAHAQIIFDVQLSERGREAVTDPDRMDDKGRMDAKMMLSLLAKEGRHAYKGEKPVMAKQIVFIVGEHGEVRERLEGKPFKMEPGVRSTGKHFPSDIFLALFEKLFPDGYFFPDTLFFPDTIFDSKKRFPDSTFDEMDLKDGQVGLVMALVPAEEDLRGEVESRPMGLVLGPVR